MANYERDWTTYVREHLEEMLEVLNMSTTEMATASGLSELVIAGILEGADIDEAQAVGLERATGILAVVWLNIQKASKEFDARQ